MLKPPIYGRDGKWSLCLFFFLWRLIQKAALSQRMGTSTCSPSHLCLVGGHPPVSGPWGGRFAEPLSRALTYGAQALGVVAGSLSL